MRSERSRGFSLPAHEIRSDILIPRYYDPRIDQMLGALQPAHKLVSLEAMVERGWVEHTFGSYVPKIFYGTGPYPYIRTSDICNFEIVASPKHGVSADVYKEYGPE